MAVSGSIDFTLTAGQVITEAFALIGVAEEAQDIGADTMAAGVLSLNMLQKTWGTDPRLWIMTEAAGPTLVAGTASYVLSPRPVRVVSARRRLSGNDTPMAELSRQEYFDLPNKSATGTPHSFYCDRQRDAATLYVYPAPNAAFVANGALPYTYARSINDIDAHTDHLDVPQEWLEALTHNLALRLAPKYPGIAPADLALLREDALRLKAELIGFDDEPASVFLSPA